VYCQSDAPVDDVNAVTSDGGILFVQAKRSVDLSPKSESGYGCKLDVRLTRSASLLMTRCMVRPCVARGGGEFGRNLHSALHIPPARWVNRHRPA
jgi:hypothetical protein